MACEAIVVEAAEIDEALRSQWDELAVAARRPHSSPVWVLAWARHVPSADIGTAVVAIRDGGELVGLLPLAVSGRGLAVMGGDQLTAEPLARPGREAEVAAAMSAAIAALAPPAATIDVEYQDRSPDWMALLGAAWPGGRAPFARVERVTPTPRLRLEGRDYEEWLASKSANFRKDIRRKERRLEKEGAEFRQASAATLREDVAAFLRLHRFRHPKGSSLDRPGVEEMLVEVGEKHLPDGRFRLVCVDAAGETDAALLLSAAGGEVSAWNSGLGERLARHTPMMQCFVYALREMAERGEDCMDFGPGDQDYKYRLSSEEGNLTSVRMLPRGSGFARARARDGLARFGQAAELAARRAGGAVKRRVA